MGLGATPKAAAPTPIPAKTSIPVILTVCFTHRLDFSDACARAHTYECRHARVLRSGCCEVLWGGGTQSHNVIHTCKHTHCALVSIHVHRMELKLAELWT